MHLEDKRVRMRQAFSPLIVISSAERRDYFGLVKDPCTEPVLLLSGACVSVGWTQASFTGDEHRLGRMANAVGYFRVLMGVWVPDPAFSMQFPLSAASRSWIQHYDEDNSESESG